MNEGSCYLEDPRYPGPDEIMRGTYRGYPVMARRSVDGRTWLIDFQEEAFRVNTLKEACQRLANRYGVKRVHPFRIWTQLLSEENMQAKQIMTRFPNSECRVCRKRMPAGTPVWWERGSGVTCLVCRKEGPKSSSPGKPGDVPSPGVPAPGEGPGESDDAGDDASDSTPTPAETKPDAPVPAASETPPPSDNAASAALRQLIGIDQILKEAAAKGAAATLSQVTQLVEREIAKGLEQIDRPRTVRIETPTAKIEPEAGEIQHPKFEQLARWIATGVTRIWITGEAGTGKTYAAERIARALNYPLHVAAPGATEYDHLGYRDAHGNYQDTAFYRWAADENPRAVLLLDEIDRNAINALQALNAGLANGIGAFPHRQMPIAKTKIVLGTANTMGEGPTIRYTGCLAQDLSVLDRFRLTIHWDLHEPTERAIALREYPYETTPKAIDASVKVRKNLAKLNSELAWGPRRTYAVCEAMMAGENTRDACVYAGLSRLLEGDREVALQGVK